MGSEAVGGPQRGVKYVVTGFSTFHGVKSNPSEQLITELVDFCKRRGDDTRCFFDSTVLNVSVATVDSFLATMAQRVSRELENDTVFWVHLGVDPKSTMISLESRAMNNASFLSPDEDGYHFLYHQIDKDYPYDQPILTSVNIDAILKRLEQLGVTVRKSFDAGRFLCNWIYYRSLRQIQLLCKSNWHSLFVHVPHFTQIPKDSQLNVIASLLRALAEEAHEQDRTDNDVTRATVNLSV
eukprot:g871.t1